MKKTKLLLWCLILSGLCITLPSCEDDDPEVVTIETSPQTLPSFLAAGEEKTLTVTTKPSDVTWEPHKTDEWITVNSSGDQLTIRTAVNEGKARSGIVTLKAQNAEDVILAVNQMAADEKVFTVSHPTLTFEAEGGQETVKVVCSAKWEAKSEDSWITIVDGDGEFTVKAAAYQATDKPREGEITVTAEGIETVHTIKVTQRQEGFVAELSIQDSDKELTFDETGGQQTVRVTGNVEWWANDKNRYEWLTVEKGDGEFTVKVDPYEDFDGPRETEIHVEAGEIDDPIVVKVIQNQGTPFLRVIQTSIEADYQSSVILINIESNTTWNIDWGTENFYCPDGHPNAGWWAEFKPNSGKGTAQIEMEFNKNYPLTSEETRTAQIIVSADGIEDITLPFTQTGIPGSDFKLTSREQLYGTWQVTNEIIMIGDQKYRNDHIITISASDLYEDAFKVSNITNINAYTEIGGAAVKGDEMDFYIDFSNDTFTLCTRWETRDTYTNMIPHWDLDQTSTTTIVVVAVREDMKETFVNTVYWPPVKINMRENGRHEINFTYPDYSIEFEGQTYYGSMQIGGQWVPQVTHYATLFGSKWTKIVPD